MKKSTKIIFAILVIIILMIIGSVCVQVYCKRLQEQTKEESIRIAEEFCMAIHTQDITKLDEIMDEDTILKYVEVATYAEAREGIVQKWENANFVAEGGEIIMSLSWFYESEATILIDNIMVVGEFGESDLSCIIRVERSDNDEYRIGKIDIHGNSNMLEEIWYTGH